MSFNEDLYLLIKMSSPKLQTAPLTNDLLACTRKNRLGTWSTLGPNDLSLTSHWCLLCLRWYHGHLSGPNAEKLLLARDEPDTFLVRESLSKPGDFVLSVLTNEKSKTGGKRVSHIKIMCQVPCSSVCVCVRFSV